MSSRPRIIAEPAVSDAACARAAAAAVSGSGSSIAGRLVRYRLGGRRVRCRARVWVVRMTGADDSNVIDFVGAGVPGMAIKPRDIGDPRRFCKHRQIMVSSDEPIIECATCHAYVDPYNWLRERCADYKKLYDAQTSLVEEAKRELAELKTALRLLRREYADEAEKRRAESSLMILPPRRRV